jgi:hypothetical protein
LQLSKGSDGLLRVGLTGAMSDAMSLRRRHRFLRELLSWSSPALLHVVISADERGSWSWAAPWQSALAELPTERVYVFHSLGDRHDGR